MSSSGIRNNNPGNLRWNMPLWNGTIGAHNGFVVFDTMANGIRAMGKQLLAYQDRHGIDTVRGAITRWAPPTENDTASYIAFVCKSLACGPDDPLNFHNQATLYMLVTAIGQQENGVAEFNTYVGTKDVASGIAMALA